MSARASFRAERRARPALWRMVVLTGGAALGTALPDLIALAHRVLS